MSRRPDFDCRLSGFRCQRLFDAGAIPDKRRQANDSACCIRRQIAGPADRPAVDVFRMGCYSLDVAVTSTARAGRMRIYIETTIPSYLVARPARDIVQAARQQLTRDWWSLRKDRHDLFTSQIAIDEAAEGDPESAARRLEILNGISLLTLNRAAETLTSRLLVEGVLPFTADRDAAHIAVASVHAMDILLSWNCRHIVNAVIQPALRRVVEAEGLSLPVICTPEEMMEEDYE